MKRIFTILGSPMQTGRNNLWMIPVLILFALISPQALHAQVSIYSFSESTETYATITGTTSTATGDEGAQNGIAIGFPFIYGGTSYSHFSISANGFIRLGTSASVTINTGNPSWQNTNFATSTNAPMIAAFWDDHNVGSGSIKYALSGVAPNQILEVDWNQINIGNGGATSTTDFASFKLRLYQTSNIIEIVYAPVMTSAGALTATVGLSAGSSVYLSVTPGTTSTTSNSTANNTISATANLVGKKYVFSPPPPCVAPTAQPTALVLTPASATTINGTFTAASPVADRYLVVRTTGAAPTNPANGTTYTAGATALGGTIVYAGNATTFASTSLTGNTNYTYYIFSYNSACTGGPVYFTASPLNGAATTCPAVPTTITTSAVTLNSFTLTWASSLGGSASPVTYTVDVATDNAFASPVVGSPFTVSDPTVSQVVSGLTGSTTYYYRVRANGSCNSAYSTTASVGTQCIVPTSQPTALVLTPASATSIGGTFTAASPAASGYLVVRTTGAVPTTPVNGTTYSTGAALGGRVVSVGTSTTFTDNSGLAGNTSYTYYVYAYSSGCTGQPVYNTTAPLTVTTITCPAVPGSIVSSAITAGGFTLTWGSTLGGNASPVSYNVEVSTSSTFATQVVGSPFTVNDPTVTQAISGLNHSTTYYYRIRSNGSCNSAYSTAANVNTSCGVNTVPTPAAQTFATVPPACWSRAQGLLAATVTFTSTTTSNWTTDDFLNITNPVNSAAKLNLYGGGISERKEWLISPSYNFGPGGQYQLEFDLGLTVWNGTTATSLGTDDKVAVLISTDNGTTWSTSNILQQWTNATLISNTGQHVAINLSSYTGTVKFAFYGESTVTNADNDLFVDNFAINVIPTCFPVTGITLNSLGINDANFSWTAPVLGVPANYFWKIVANGAGANAPAIVSGTVAHPTLSTPVTGLNASTAYQLYVRTDCGSGDSSSWAASPSFTTLCDASNIPYTMPITGIVEPALPSCVTQVNANNDASTWKSLSTGTLNGWTLPVLLYEYSATNPANDWLFTRGLNLNAGVTYLLKYKYNNSGVGLYPEKMKVMYGNANTAAAMTNLLVDYPAIANSTPQMAYITFTPASSGIYYIGFHAYSDADLYRIILDDISVEVAPTCLNPSSPAVSNVTASQATLSWTAPTSGTPANYIWKIVAAGAGSGATAISQGIVPAPATSTTINGYAVNTNYDVYLRTECGGGDTSAWVNTSFSSTTAYCNPAPSSVDGLGIVGVAMGTINNTSGAESGNYGNYSNLVTNVIRGLNFPINITYNTGYEYGTIIWVDLNQNNVFENAELLYYGLSDDNEPTTLAASITIPQGTPFGQYRIRIGGTDLDDGPTGPCYNGTYGSFEDYTLNVIDYPATPTSLTQSAIVPDCIGGSSLYALPTVPANVVYYLQTAANDTSTVVAFVGDSVIVNTNGTYYVRARNSVTNLWSTGTASIVVNNIPVAPLPPTPVASVNPACVSTTISVPAPGSLDVTFYWQGTTENGTSNANSATTPLTVTTSGTYYVSAYDATSGCWSNTSGINIAVDHITPVAPVSGGNIASCADATSIEISAVSTVLDSVVVSFGTNLQSPGTPVSFNATIPTLPVGATLAGATLKFTNVVAINGSYRSEIRVALSGSATLPATQISTLASVGTITPDPSVNVTTVSTSGGPVTLTLSETADDSFSNPSLIDATFGSATLVVRYNVPTNITWWDASTAGNQQGTGSPLETIGTTLLPDTDTPGDYIFYAQSNVGACVNSTRTPITVKINPLPTVDAGATQTNVCPSSQVTLSGSGAVSYTWNNGVQNGVAFAAPYVNTLYTVTGVDANNCSNTDTVSIIAAPTSPVVITPAGPIVTCQNQPVTLEVNGLGAGAFAQWNFNGLADANVPAPSIGTGVASAIGATTPSFVDGSLNGGSSDAAALNDAWSLTNFPAQGTNFGTAGAQFNVSTVGQENIIFSFDQRNSDDAANKLLVQFTTDVTATTPVWSNTIPFASINANYTNGRTVNFTGVPGVDNNANFAVRLVADSSNGTGAYVPTVGAVYTQTGTIGLDMVTFNGTPQSQYTFLWSTGATSATITPTVSGTYKVTVTESGVCTGLDSVEVTINPVAVTIISPQICAGGSYTLVDNTVVTTANTYTRTTTSAITGCDSIVTVNLIVNPLYTVTVNDTICSNQNYELADGTFVTAANTYTVTVPSISNCDSTVTVNLFVLPAQSVTVNDTICANEQFTLPNGTIVTAAGSYTNTFPAVNGCDSTIITVLYVKPVFTSTQNPSICSGDTHTMPDGTQQGVGGTYTFPYTSVVNGCDSTITVNLTIRPVYTTNLTVNLCPGDDYTLVDNTVVSTNGVYSAVTNAVNGCDSTVIVTVIERLDYNTAVAASICDGDSYALANGATVTAAGTYTVATQSIYGCDSIVVVTLTVKPSVTTPVSVAICAGEDHELADGTTVSTAGTYTTVVQSSLGCDSTIVTTLSVNPSPSVNLGNDIVVPSGPVTLNAGIGHSSYLWNTGATTQTLQVTQSGTYSVTITNQFGCEATDAVQVNFTSSIVNLGENGGIITLFPNPTTDRFTVNVNGYTGGGDIKLELINAIGQVVKTELVSNATESFMKNMDVSDLASGTYTLSVKGNKANANLRLVIAR